MENASNNYIWVSNVHYASYLKLNYDDYCKYMEDTHGLLKVVIPPSEFNIPKYNHRLFKVVDKGKALKFFFDCVEFIVKPEKK